MIARDYILGERVLFSDLAHERHVVPLARNYRGVQLPASAGGTVVGFSSDPEQIRILPETRATPGTYHVSFIKKV